MINNFNPKELLDKEVKTESELKELIVNYVGNKLKPESDKITVEQTIKVFAEEFPEFVLVIAEEYWVSGYTQALRDAEIANKNQQEVTPESENDNKE